jgi:hypothetical protein
MRDSKHENLVDVAFSDSDTDLLLHRYCM